MGTTAEQQTPQTPETPAALEAEKGELQQDIKEAQQQAQQARKDGDDERATRLEASIAKTQADLDEIKGLLKGMADRPFAPAPGDGEAPPATPADGEQKQGQEQQQEEKPPPRKKRRHAFFGDRWDTED